MGAELLLLDDDPNVHELIKLRLTGIDVNLDSCFDTDQAIKQLNVKKYDLLLIDIVMDHKHSSEKVLAFLHGPENKMNMQLPLVIMSAYIDETHEKRFSAKSSLVSKVMKKPLDFIELRKFLKDFFGLNHISTKSEGDNITVVTGSDDELLNEKTMVKGQKEVLTEEILNIKKIASQNNKQKLQTHIDARDSEGNSLLMRLIRFGYEDEVVELLNLGANTFLKNRKGQGAMHLATLSDNLSLIQLLMANGLDLHQKDDQNLEPLAYALIRGSHRAASFMIEQGAKLNRRIKGKSYLMVAVKSGNLENIELLLKNRPDLKIKDPEGKTVADYVTKKNDPKIEQIFIKYYPDFSN